MALEHVQPRRRVPQVPKSDSTVFRPREQEKLAVRAEGHGVNLCAVAGDDRRGSFLARVPQPHRAVVRGRAEEVVGAQVPGHVLDDPLVVREGPERRQRFGFLAADVPEAHPAVVGAGE